MIFVTLMNNYVNLSLNLNELNSDINNNKIEITEIKTNKSSLFDNSDFNKE